MDRFDAKIFVLVSFLMSSLYCLDTTIKKCKNQFQILQVYFANSIVIRENINGKPTIAATSSEILKTEGYSKISPSKKSYNENISEDKLNDYNGKNINTQYKSNLPLL